MSLWSELRELGKIVSEGAADLTEILTDGFGEMVTRGNSEYMTSFEKRDMATNIIDSAQYRYEMNVKIFETMVSEIQALLKARHLKMAVVLNGTVKQWVEATRNVKYVSWMKLCDGHPGFLEYLEYADVNNMEELLKSAATVAQSSEPSVEDSHPSYAFSGTTPVGMAAGGGMSLLVPALGSPAILVALPAYVAVVAFDQNRRVREADKFLARAKRHELEVDTAIATMELFEESFLAVQQRLDEFDQLIQTLEICLKPLIEELYQVSMHQKRWWRRFLFHRLRAREMNTLRTSYNLVTAIQNLCKTPVMTKEGFVSPSLKSLLDNLQRDAANIVR